MSKLDPISNVASAITEVTKLLSKWLGSTDHRRMAKCIRNDDRIVKRIRELGIEDKELDRLMKKHEKYNN